MSCLLLLEMALSLDANRTAVGTGAESLTVEQLYQRALYVGAVVCKRKATELVYVGENGPQLAAMIFGAAAAGVPFAPLNYRLPAGVVTDQISGMPNPYVVADAAGARMLSAMPVPLTPLSDVLSARSQTE